MARTKFKSTPTMRVLAAAIAANVPTLLMGDPGLAKTATIENAAAQWGRHCQTIVGSSREATDFLGVMAESEDSTIIYKPFQWVKDLNDSPSGLLFLDELNRAPLPTMNAMLRLLQERHVGDTKLGDHVSIVAAANPQSSNQEVEQLTAAAANRMLHLDWEFDVDSWMQNLPTDFENSTFEDITGLVNPDPRTRMAVVGAEIGGFINHDRSKLKPGPPKDAVKASGAWASPRSWHNLTKVYAQLADGDDDALLLAAKGLVGEGAATAFMAWKAQADLINPMLVLKDPSAVDWTTTRSDRLFVLVNSVAAIGLTDEDHWDAAVNVMAACAAGGKPDAALPSATRLLNNMPRGATVSQDVREHFGDLLNRTSRGIRAAA